MHYNQLHHALSHIQGYKRRGAFLATQAPMKETVEDFWHMIWETQSKAIVMLCNLEEEGKVGCVCVHVTSYHHVWSTVGDVLSVLAN